VTLTASGSVPPTPFDEDDEAPVAATRSINAFRALPSGTRSYQPDSPATESESRGARSPAQVFRFRWW